LRFATVSGRVRVGEEVCARCFFGFMESSSLALVQQEGWELAWDNSNHFS
jgi:hypothetical protein